MRSQINANRECISYFFLRFPKLLHLQPLLAHVPRPPVSILLVRALHGVRRWESLLTVSPLTSYLMGIWTSGALGGRRLIQPWPGKFPLLVVWPNQSTWDRLAYLRGVSFCGWTRCWLVERPVREHMVCFVSLCYAMLIDAVISFLEHCFIFVTVWKKIKLHFFFHTLQSGWPYPGYVGWPRRSLTHGYLASDTTTRVP